MAAPLTEGRWRRLEALFAAAVALPPGEREAFAQCATADNPELASELRGMLAHTSDGGERILLAIEQAAVAAAPPSTWIGRRCGRYRITREIGRGGMGIVFEAVRDDDEFRKTVAVKVAPFWRSGIQGEERFRLERQILAGLEHPNIARLLDGGTQDGVPYFVMEFVDGAPITVHCRTRALDLEARVALFRRVCAAVDFAHQHLVVHRDLKPANVLVSDDGTPKLLDFGIAKILDPFAESGTTATIETGWTPDYTSPEQVRGGSITTRTDVYSLGLVLYELVTGQRAQVADTSSPLALDRSIGEVDPPLPSVRAAADGDRALAHRLRGDLDAIVMTAIRKEPERRYGTAAALSDDLGRYLDGHPVLARLNTARYRAAKFLRRHWAGAAASVLLLASVTAGAASTLYQARRAERRFTQVRTLANTFVFDVHDRVATLPGSTGARKAIVQTALTYLENLSQEAGTDSGLSRELAAAYHKIGRVQGEPISANLGDTAGAVASFTRAAALLTPLANHGDRVASRQLVSVIVSLANVEEAQGHRDVAMQTFARAEAIGEQLLQTEPENLELLSSLSGAYAAMSRTAMNIADFAYAEQAARRSMELARTAAQREPANRRHRDTLSDAHSALSSALRSTGRLSDAAESIRASIAVREQLVAEEPDNIDYRRQLLIGYGHLGDLLGFRSGENLGDLGGAAVAFERAVTLAEWARQRDPMDRRAWSDLTNARFRLGSVLAADPRHVGEGLAQLEDAERWAARLLAPDPSVYQHAYLAIGIERAIADALTALGRFDEAARRLDHVRTVAPRFMDGRSGPDARGQFVWATLRLAMLRARAGDSRAAALADRAGLDLNALGTLVTPFGTAKAWGDLGRVYVEIARHDATNRRRWLAAATPLLEKSVALWHGVKLAPGAEGQYRKELDGVDADLAASRMLDSTSRP